MKGLLKYLPPFAPDQSGAAGVLYELGGMTVICDAGGCTGNICGFDEPRWFTKKSAVFSAGLRDLDAVLGRDDKLVSKLAEAAEKLHPAFAALLGTPVPAVIGTDFNALRRMAEKQTGLPVLTAETTGTKLYDTGEETMLFELFSTFAKEIFPIKKGTVGVLGVTPLSLSSLKAAEKIKAALAANEKNAVCYTMDAKLDDVRHASAAEFNLVVSPSGLKAAEYLKNKFGTPFTVKCPVLPESLLKIIKNLNGKKILIVHQQVLANSLRDKIEAEAHAQVTVSTWFALKSEFARNGDFRFKSEEQFAEAAESGRWDVIICDKIFSRIPHDCKTSFLDFPHFAVSGRLCS